MSANAVRMGARSWTAVILATLVGVMAFGWPFLAEPGSTAVAHSADAPWVFAAIVPLVLLVVLAQVADGGMDAKAIAILGVLAAVICILRPLGAGTAGLEPIWFVIILGGRALGPGFGFSLGALSLAASALLTGGVGPWLAFQMIAAAWVGLGAGLLPPWPGASAQPTLSGSRGRSEIAMLAAYGMVASMAYGLVMNLWFWPFLSGLEATAYAPAILFDPGAPVTDNLARWLAFSLVTSLGWDIPRGILTAVLIIVAGRPILTALERASRRANFAPAVEFVDGRVIPPSDGMSPLQPATQRTERT
ncbi:MAG: ECF transporter S component [Candidatus Nanopelagicales bacterium]|jgi:energy-coupling factor transport system substrate-specific component